MKEYWQRFLGWVAGHGALISALGVAICIILALYEIAVYLEFI